MFSPLLLSLSLSFFCNLVPSAPPHNVTVTALSSSSLSIRWSPVPTMHRNGKIIGYSIVLYDELMNTSKHIMIGGENEELYFDVKKYYNYSIRVAANTSVGRGEYSSWIKIRTLEDGKKNMYYFCCCRCCRCCC